MICEGGLIIPPETQRKLVIKSVHDDIQCGVATTQKRIKLETRWPGYSRDVEEYIKRCKKCKQLRNFTLTTLHKWPIEVEQWNRVHMDNAYITGEEHLFIFSRNSIPKTLVSDNAPEFCDEDPNLWLEKIGCKPHKIPP